MQFQNFSKFFVLILTLALGLSQPANAQILDKVKNAGKKVAEKTIGDPAKVGKTAKKIGKWGRDAATTSTGEAVGWEFPSQVKIGGNTIAVGGFYTRTVTDDSVTAIFAAHPENRWGILMVSAHRADGIRVKSPGDTVLTDVIAYNLTWQEVKAEQLKTENRDALLDSLRQLPLHAEIGIEKAKETVLPGGWLTDSKNGVSVFFQNPAKAKAEAKKEGKDAEKKAKAQAEADRIAKAKAEAAKRAEPTKPASNTTPAPAATAKDTVTKPASTATTMSALNPATVKGFTLTYKPGGPAPRTVKGTPTTDGVNWRFDDGGFKLQVLSTDKIKFGAMDLVEFVRQADGSYAAADKKDGRKIVFE